MLSLQNIMRANALSCITFGALFALQPSSVAIFLGGDAPAPEIYILILGVILMINSAHLLWASTIPLPKKELVLYFSIGDFIWVAASVVLIILDVWITTSNGILTTYIVSAMVGLFGVLQMFSRKAMGHC